MKQATREILTKFLEWCEDPKHGLSIHLFEEKGEIECRCPIGILGAIGRSDDHEAYMLLSDLDTEMQSCTNYAETHTMEDLIRDVKGLLDA